MPNLAWAQIVLIVALFDNSILAQDPTKDPGDVAGDFWVRHARLDAHSKCSRGLSEVANS